MNKLRPSRAHLLWLAPALALAAACSSGDDDDGAPNNASGKDAGAGATDASTQTGTPDTGTGSTPDSSTGTGGRTPITSTCAAASVTLGTEVSTPVPNETNFDNVVSGYFNSDGKADVAILVGNSGTETIQVFLSNGDGTFAAPKVTSQQYDTGESGESTAVVDVNGDGLDDLLVGGPDASENEAIALFLSKGDGTFQPPVYTAWGDNSPGLLQVLTGDFNGDKKIDIFYTSENNGDGVIAGTAAGGFTGPGTAVNAPGDWLAVGDLNGDGVADIVSNIKDADTPGPCVYLNNGTGTFPATPTCATPGGGATGFDFVNIADVNKDGKQDLVATQLSAADLTTANINVFLGTGTGTFGDAVPYTLDKDLRAVKIVDVNNDGFLDYVGNDQTNVGAQLDVLLNDGTGKFAATPVTYAFGTENAFHYSPFASGDFAGNGLTGFAGISYSTAGVPAIDTVVATCKP